MLHNILNMLIHQTNLKKKNKNIYMYINYD